MKNYEHEFYVTRKCTKYEYFTVRANSMEEAKDEVETGWDYYDFDYEEFDLELEYERVTKQRYEDFQEWLNKCPLVVTDYQDYTNEFVITFNLEAD